MHHCHKTTFHHCHHHREASLLPEHQVRSVFFSIIFFTTSINDYTDFDSHVRWLIIKSRKLQFCPVFRVRPKICEHSWWTIEWKLSRTNVDQSWRRSTTVCLYISCRTASTCRIDFHVIRSPGKATWVSLHFHHSVPQSHSFLMHRDSRVTYCHTQIDIHIILFTFGNN